MINKIITMIFYFSGTGNSRWIAGEVANVQQETLISIADEMKKQTNSFEYTLQENEIIGFIFPVYSWAPPAIVLDFISKINFVNYQRHYLFFICSCGDDIGLTHQVLCKAVKTKGWEWNAGFSVMMPNNYVLMAGFDTDSKDVVQKKLTEAVPALERINKYLTGRVSPVFDYHKGRFAFLKTRLINPLFNKFQITAKPFYATDACVGCKLCEKACPVANITVTEKPVWGSNCTSCLACYHVCPRNAVQYGKVSQGKGQYFNPNRLNVKK